jgi:hypothetical protein
LAQDLPNGLRRQRLLCDTDAHPPPCSQGTRGLSVLFLALPPDWARSGGKKQCQEPRSNYEHHVAHHVASVLSATVSARMPSGVVVRVGTSSAAR